MPNQKRNYIGGSRSDRYVDVDFEAPHYLRYYSKGHLVLKEKVQVKFMAYHLHRTPLFGYPTWGLGS